MNFIKERDISILFKLISERCLYRKTKVHLSFQILTGSRSPIDFEIIKFNFFFDFDKKNNQILSITA